MTEQEWTDFKAKIAGHTGAAWEAKDQNGPAAAFGCVASVGIFSHAKLVQAQARLQALGDDAEDDDDPMDSAWVCGIWGSLTVEDRANAALIAAAPTLVAEVERLRAENERLRKTLGIIEAANGSERGCPSAWDPEDLLSSLRQLARTALTGSSQ